jgi:hypothetical protein
VAGQHIFIYVMGKGNLTASAAKDEAAFTALYEGGGSPAVEKQDYLLSPGYCPGYRF